MIKYSLTISKIMLLCMLRYINRREEVFSEENMRDPHILSLIVDIMDQNHCQLPWNGTQGSFAEPLKQKIIGVKEHGYGVQLFSAIDIVRKGANLMIYIIDSVIEKWKERHGGVYPTKIYLQDDGGSENANK
jgi:hypothetical protein